MIRALAVGGVQLLNDHERPGHLLVDYLRALPPIIRYRHPANDNAPKPGEVTVEPDAIPEAAIDVLLVELAKAPAERDHTNYHTSSTP